MLSVSVQLTCVVPLTQTGWSRADMLTMVTSIHGVLNALLIHHAPAVTTAMAALLAATSRLLKCIMVESRQRDGVTLTDTEVSCLEQCAHLVSRCVSTTCCA